jgi:hypothetical protein
MGSTPTMPLANCKSRDRRFETGAAHYGAVTEFVSGCEEHLTRSAVPMMPVSVTRYSPDALSQRRSTPQLSGEAVDVCGENAGQRRIALNQQPPLPTLARN